MNFKGSVMALARTNQGPQNPSFSNRGGAESTLKARRRTLQQVKGYVGRQGLNN